MDQNHPRYWKGLDELAKTPEFEKNRHKEFSEKLPAKNDLLADLESDLTSNRRDFLKVMGFGISAATLAACTKQPVRKAIPYLVKPQEIEIGIPNYYATTCQGCHAKCGILAKTREGRPIKIEGNYENPMSKGGVCAVGQATVLSLYDQARIDAPRKKGSSSKVNWNTIDTEVINALNGAQGSGKGIRILTGTVNSPSTLAAIELFRTKFPTAQHISYDAVSVSALRDAHLSAFGKAMIPGYKFDTATMVVSFGADFLGTWISPVEYTKGYSAARAISKGDNRLYHVQFESTLSLTGSNADLRAPLLPSQLGQALLKLHNLVAQGAGGASQGSTPSIELAGNSLAHAAKELLKRRGKGIVVCGSNDLAHQTLVLGINQMLGNYGSTLATDNYSLQKTGDDKATLQLVEDMNNGSVDVLLIIGSNPVYTMPDQAKMKSALAKVKTVVALCERLDETSTLATHIAPVHHFLESWGDDRPKANSYHLQQPTITPIFKTRDAVESLAKWAGRSVDKLTFMREVWGKQIFVNGGGFPTLDEAWTNTVHNGFYSTESTASSATGSYNGGTLASAAAAVSSTAAGKDALEVILYEKVGIRDGKDANNPWLQELPDPVSKATWDQYATVSPKWAMDKGLEDGDLVEVKANGVSIKVPIVRQPGQRNGTIGLAYGYGQKMTGGKVLDEAGGHNVFGWNSVKGGYINHTGTFATVSDKVGYREMALTQTHHHMESRDLVRETTTGDLAKGYVGKPKEKDTKAGHGAEHHLMSMYKDYRFPGHHWGMVIDLNACTGCNACVVSCTAENNIAVVGRDEVRRRREMHWLRIDRYYALGAIKGKTAESIDVRDGYIDKYKEIDKAADDEGVNFEDVKVLFQPMLCQHCTNAPCENVCPVNAISHSSEGINQQVYNRCIGTRYCANNCPYKVRRFNWFEYVENNKFDYHLNNPLGRMVLNPDVTVRMRGVMEKCSFCVQRIQVSKLEAKKEGRPLKDGEIKTACQQTCPADAIIFGDMNDPNSQVSQLLKDKRSYGILTELNTRPVVNYQSKVRHLPQTQAV